MITKDLVYKFQLIEVSNGNKCAVHQIYKESNSKPVIMVHGIAENSSIFFSKNGKGFAPFLARNGFNVFLVDLPGKGLSVPSIERGFNSGMFQFINHDFNIIISFIKSKIESKNILAVAHSWGGVLLLSNYAKFAEENLINKFVFFGVKKNVIINSFGKFLRLTIGLGIIGRFLNFIYGYFPSKKVLKFGIDDEPYLFAKDTIRWAKTTSWVDCDGFNYAKEFKLKQQPKILCITGQNDLYYGERGDCIKTLKQCVISMDSVTLMHLSIKNGNLKNYGHNDMLSDKKATKDHFPKILEWINNN